MKVALHALHEQFEHITSLILPLHHFSTDFVYFFAFREAAVSTVDQKIVWIFKLLREDDLDIAQYESTRYILLSTQLHQILKIFTSFGKSIRSVDGNFEGIHASHAQCQARQGAAPTRLDTYEQRVTSLHSKDSRKCRKMVNHFRAQHNINRPRRHFLSYHWSAGEASRFRQVVIVELVDSTLFLFQNWLCECSWATLLISRASSAGERLLIDFGPTEV